MSFFGSGAVNISVRNDVVVVQGVDSQVEDVARWNGCLSGVVSILFVHSFNMAVKGFEVETEFVGLTGKKNINYSYKYQF